MESQRLDFRSGNKEKGIFYHERVVQEKTVGR
jgi:hypothetical protein